MKKVLLFIFIGIVSIIIFPFYSVNALNISTLDVTSNNNKMTVTGTTENGVLAVAVLVYSEENLIHIETCSSNSNKYSCELNKTFELGNYNVKVADYNGGDYISKNIVINENSKEHDLENPQTGDNIMLYIGLGLISLIGLTGTIVYKKKVNVK